MSVPDLSPVLDADPLDLRVSLAALIHWADSVDQRHTIMAAVDFPVDDMLMFLTVNQLCYRGATRPSDLASILGTGRANMSKVAGRLDTIGFTVRVPSQDDERSVLLALTPSGREMGQRIMDFVRTSLAEALAGWTQKDVAALSTTMARFVRDATGQLR